MIQAIYKGMSIRIIADFLMESLKDRRDHGNKVMFGKNKDINQDYYYYQNYSTLLKEKENLPWYKQAKEVSNHKISSTEKSRRISQTEDSKHIQEVTRITFL